MSSRLKGGKFSLKRFLTVKDGIIRRLKRKGFVGLGMLIILKFMSLL